MKMIRPTSGHDCTCCTGRPANTTLAQRTPQEQGLRLTWYGTIGILRTGSAAAHTHTFPDADYLADTLRNYHQGHDG
jgi:hypothetical protein